MAVLIRVIAFIRGVIFARARQIYNAIIRSVIIYGVKI